LPNVTSLIFPVYVILGISNAMEPTSLRLDYALVFRFSLPNHSSLNQYRSPVFR